MKSKALIIVSIIFITIGLGLGLYGMYKLDWSYSALDTREFEELEYQHSEDMPALTKVIVDTKHQVKVVKGEKFKLNYFQQSKLPTTITCDENGVLTITTDKQYKWDWRIFNFKESKLYFTLTLPEGVSLDLDSINAQVELVGLNFDSISICAVNTEIKIEDCVGKKLDIDSSNANVVMINANINDFNCDSTNMTLKESTLVAENIKIDAMNMTMHESQFSVNKMEISSVNLSMKLTVAGKATEYSVEIDSINNDVDIRPNIGTDPNKIIIIDTASMSGHLKFTE